MNNQTQNGCLSVCSSVYLSGSLSFCLSVSACLLGCLSVSQSVSRSLGHNSVPLPRFWTQHAGSESPGLPELPVQLTDCLAD